MYPVFASLRIQLGVVGLIQLTATCKRLYALRQYIWDINRALRRFLDNPLAFRTLLGETDALISGSFVLQFLEGVVWKNSDLDVFIQAGKAAYLFGEYLERVEGYEYVEPKKKLRYGVVRAEGAPNQYISDFKVQLIHYLVLSHDTTNLHVTQVNTYLRPLDRTGSQPKIQIIITEDLPIARIIESFYTTAVVNVISWNRSYAIYAAPTFKHHKTYLQKKLDDTIGGLLRKYSQRGWQTDDILWREEAKDPRQPFRQVRRVGDRWTWILPLDTSGVKASKTPDSVLEYSQFSMTALGAEEEPRGVHDIGAPQIAFYAPCAMGIYATILNHEYTWGNSRWHDTLLERLNRLSYIELMKIKPEERPEEFDPDDKDLRGLHMLPPVRCPEWWTCFDAELPKWYALWEKEWERLHGL
jgi:hypothetical protein